jgi:hypothetical protein
MQLLLQLQLPVPAALHAHFAKQPIDLGCFLSSRKIGPRCALARFLAAKFFSVEQALTREKTENLVSQRAMFEMR